MAFRRPRVAGVFLLAWGPFGFQAAPPQPPLPIPAAEPEADAAAVQRLAEEFFAAYARKDLEGFLRLWSPRSPDLDARKQEMQTLFAANQTIEVNNLIVGNVKLAGEKASVRATVEMSAVAAKTGQPATGFGETNRALHFVREDGTWRLWREAPAAEDLALALVEAQTGDERAALLATEKELVTAGLWRALDAQGDRISLHGDYARALAAYALEQAIAEQIGDRLGIAQAFSSTAVIHQIQSNYALALEYHQKALAIREALGNKTGIAGSLTNIGLINDYQGNYALALEYLQKSLKLREELGDKTRVAESLLNIANIHYEQGDYDLALGNYGRALTQFEAEGDKWRSGYALNNVGVIYQDRGNYALALQYFQKSLALREEIADKAGMASTLGNMGVLYFAQGNYGLALEYYRKSLALNEALGRQDEIATQLDNIAGVHRAQGNYKLALEDYQNSWKVREAIGDKQGIAHTLNGIGNTHRLQNNLGLALEFYRKSLALRETLGGKPGTAETLHNIALVQHAQGNYSQALETAARAAAIARQLGARETLWSALTTQGRAYRALGQFAQARQVFDEAIATVESLRTEVAGGEQEQESFFEDKVFPYHAMVELLAAQNRSSEALAYAERAKARVLLDVLGSGRVNITKAMTEPEQDQEHKLKNDLVSLNTQMVREDLRPQPDQTRLADLNASLHKARLNYESFQTGLYAAHPELKVRRGEARPVSWDEIGALLPDARSALLEYVLTDDMTFLFVLTRQDAGTRGNGDAETQGPIVRIYTLAIKRKDLAERAVTFRRQLAQRDLNFGEAARKLYDLLLAPAREELQGKTTLVIVPDGVLWELPFQALQPAPNRHLIEDHALSYAPSLTVLREMTKARGQRPPDVTGATTTLLAFGNPALGKQTVERVRSVLSDERLDPQPDAERLVEALRRVYGASQSTVYIGAEAREERLKAEASKYRILQLATHGILNNASPMYSQLLLSQATANAQEDGLLEAWEIMNLDLKADLVVLSACETALGRVGAGEGMIGLTWALFVAGCPTTVVSQWKVESASTTQLMLEFHRNLRPGIKNPQARVGTAKALQEAAIKMLRSNKYRHPFYWAGFVVIGDAS